MKSIVKVVIIALLLPIAVFAKGGGANSVGLWMEGTLTNVTAVGDKIHLQLTGSLTFLQYPDDIHRSSIKVGCKNISATLDQTEPFFAMTSDWNGGSLQQKGRLTEILKTAAEHQRVVRFELVDSKIAFDGGRITNVESSVVRATDADLH